MSWKAISFYTENYKDEVDILIKSLVKFEIPYDIELVKSRGDWKENTFYKIPFIIRKLRQYNHPLVWLDADAEVVQYPRMFDTMDGALMAGIYSPIKVEGKRKHGAREFVSNTMYLVPSKEVFGFLGEVDKFIKDVPTAYDKELLGEQLYFQEVLENNDWKYRLKFSELPYSYGIPSYWGMLKKLHSCYKEAPVIKQRQASRRKNPQKRKFYKELNLPIND